MKDATMNLQDHAADAVLTKVGYVAQGGAVVSAGSGIVLGLTQAEWTVIGIIGGLVVSVIFGCVHAVISWHFKAEHLRLAAGRARGFLDEDA